MARQPLVLPLLFRRWVLLFHGSLITREYARASLRLLVLLLFRWIHFFRTLVLVPTLLLVLLSPLVRALDKEVLVSLISVLTHLDVVVKLLMPLIRHAKIPPPAGEQSESSSGRAGEASRRSGELVPTIDAPVFNSESSGQGSVDVSDYPAPYLIAPVPIGANSGQRMLMSPILTSRLSQLPPVRALDKEVLTFLILSTEARLVQFYSLPAQQL